jgi:hypothetical protein
MEKKVNYAFPMWICVACIIIIASLAVLMNGFFDNFDKGITQIRAEVSKVPSASPTEEIILQLKNSSIPQLLDFKEEIETLKNDFEIQNSQFLSVFQ